MFGWGLSVHLPRLAFCSAHVTGRVALTRKHTGAAGHAHTAKSTLAIVKNRVFRDN